MPLYQIQICFCPLFDTFIIFLKAKLEKMASFDSFAIVQKNSHFVDPHLALLIIEHYEQSNYFTKQQIHNEKIALLSKTKSYDLFIEEVEKTPKEGVAKDQIERLVKGSFSDKYVAKVS